MEIGVGLPAYGSGAHAVTPELIGEWAERAEHHGFAGLWAMDHLVQPDSYALTVLDPLVSLSVAASVTDSIPLGTSILLTPIRRTAVIASQALSLRYLADRDVTLGVGAGYVPREFDVAGIDRRERGPRLSESIDVLQQLFDGEASYDGRFHSFEDVRIDPVLESPPNLLAGGRSIEVDDGDGRHFPPPMLDRIFATSGWVAPPTGPDRIDAELSLLRDAAVTRERDFESLTTVLLQYVHVADEADDVVASQKRAFESFYDGPLDFTHAQQHCLTGSVDEIRSQIATYAEHGIDQLILSPVTTPENGLHRQIDAYAEAFL